MFEGWPLERQFRFIAETGYDGVELAPFTVAKQVTDVPSERRRELAALAREAGVDILGLHWLLVGPEGLHITDPDPAVRQRTTAYLEELMRFCADLGGRILVFGSPGQRNLQPGVSREAAREWLIEAFGKALNVADEVGVTLCLEPLPPPECTFIRTTAEALDVIRTIDHPRLRLILDVKSMAGEQEMTGVPIPDIIRRVAPFVAHVQANDANRGYPGSGEIDFVPIFRALLDSGYDGYVSVEVFDFSPGPEAIAQRSIAYLRQSLATASA
ncbi:MAG TPA: sugar phosphate isomerase/epimerase family protein [Chloroflexota bacterium]|nr:sugar phosphate isomerase/epimerase family protein [Chloroflexota bacterium]